MVAFASALAGNKTLKMLNFECCMDEDSSDDENDNELVTERGWEAMSTLLCNKSSIMNTYNSNHTLHSLCAGDTGADHETMGLPDNLSSYLDLNWNKNKVEVARQKILQTHFSTDDHNSKMQVFLDMDLEIMPVAIAWMGRPLPIGWEGTQVSGLSLLYNFTRRLPDLFDSNTVQKKTSTAVKRKRDNS